jgi:HEAT repeat protein
MKRAVKTLREILRRQSDAELLWNLDEREADVQAKICLELGRRRTKDAVVKLRSRLGSPNAALREAATEALGEIGDPSVSEDLLKLLLDREQPEGVRDTCAFALAKLKYTPAVAELASALSDPAPSIRLCVIAALAAIRNPVVRERVEQALAIESEPAVRSAMAHLLDLLPRGSIRERKLAVGFSATLRNPPTATARMSELSKEPRQQTVAALSGSQPMPSFVGTLQDKFTQKLLPAQAVREGLNTLPEAA